jgi:hypothetical protein
MTKKRKIKDLTFKNEYKKAFDINTFAVQKNKIKYLTDINKATISWKGISYYPYLLNNKFYDKFYDKLYFYDIIIRSENKIHDKYCNYLSTYVWENLSKCIALYKIPKYKKFINWKRVSERADLTPQFINKFKSKLDFNQIVSNKTMFLNESFFRKYKDKIDLKKAVLNHDIPESFIEKNFSGTDWHSVGYYKQLSTKFLNKHWEKIPFDVLINRQILSKNILNKIIIHNKYYNYLNISNIRDFVNKQAFNLDENLLDKYLTLVEEDCIKIHLEGASVLINLSEKFLNKYKEYFNHKIFHNISKFQNLSEKFMIDNLQELDWKGIARFQNFSFEFFVKYSYLLEVKNIKKNNRFSKGKKQKMLKYLSLFR